MKCFSNYRQNATDYCLKFSCISLVKSNLFVWIKVFDIRWFTSLINKHQCITLTYWICRNHHGSHYPIFTHHKHNRVSHYQTIIKNKVNLLIMNFGLYPVWASSVRATNTGAGWRHRDVKEGINYRTSLMVSTLLCLCLRTFHFVKLGVTWVTEPTGRTLARSFQLTECWQNSCDMQNLSLHPKSVLVTLTAKRREGKSWPWPRPSWWEEHLEEYCLWRICSYSVRSSASLFSFNISN